MRCNNCNVEIGESNICPLCHEKITDNTNNEKIIIKNEYPPKQEKRPLPFRLSVKTIYLIIAVIATIICILVNYLTPNTTRWCWFMLAVFIHCYLLIANTIFSNSEIGAKIFIQGVSATHMCYIYELIFKTNVATSYCLPIIISSMIIISAGTLIIFHKHNKTLFVSCNFISLLGFIPIILYACKVTTILAPAIVSAVLGGIALICSIVFGIKHLKEQYSKVFHM